MGRLSYDMLWDNLVLNDMEKMTEIGDICAAVVERMEVIQNLDV